MFIIRERICFVSTSYTKHFGGMNIVRKWVCLYEHYAPVILFVYYIMYVCIVCKLMFSFAYCIIRECFVCMDIVCQWFGLCTYFAKKLVCMYIVCQMFCLHYQRVEEKFF